MKKIKAKIVADSISPQGHRITTMLLTFPRFILAELNTHRVFSRNSASSRAIPFEKMVKMVEEDPFIPIAWQKDHRRMQGTEYLDPNKKYVWEEIHSAIKAQFLEGFENEDRSQMLELFDRYVSDLFNSNSPLTVVGWWLKIKDMVVASAIILYGFGVTKQLCNRLLEPFMWHTALVTATEFDNFFKLRCPQCTYKGEIFKSWKDLLNANLGTFPKTLNTIEERMSINKSQAEIHIQALAESMWDTMNESKPKELEAGEWHIPFGDQFDTKLLTKTCSKLKIPVLSWQDGERVKVWIATARCARLSYLTFDSAIDYAKDIQLHDQLLVNGHMSPFEHCARAMSENEYTVSISNGFSRRDYSQYGWCNNFRGWIQYRYLIENV
jgi:thymidylate synthase ThyX